MTLFLTTNMTTLTTAELFQPELMTPSWSATNRAPSLPAFVSRHPAAGDVEVTDIQLPFMRAISMNWQTRSDFSLVDPSPCDGIHINFMLTGAMDSTFNGIPAPLAMRTGTHNLIHTPEAGHINHISGNQHLQMLLLQIDKSFFVSSLGEGDAWSDHLLTELDAERPFAGSAAPSMITPHMLGLIRDTCNPGQRGPMRNLLLQSKMLELLALQLDQFRTPEKPAGNIPAHEADKLRQLKAYLDTHFLEDHSLAGLSRYCALNEFKVKKGFKQLFDTTVFQYIRQLRMQHAGLLLRNSPVSVDEIADQLGYEHAQHFSIAFKKFTGHTPTQYQLRA